MVPPALGEIGELELQRVLEELEGNAADLQHPPVANDEGLT